MATIVGVGGGGLPDGIQVSIEQTGNGPSTHTVDRGGGLEAGLVQIVSTVGAAPTVTVDIQGSADGSTWWNVAYAAAPLAANVGALSVASMAITTATLTRLFLPPNEPWRFMRLNYTGNNNVTLTSTVWVF